MSCNISVHYSAGPKEFERMNTAELRENFLLSGLFQAGRLNMVISDLDRMAVGAAMPQDELALHSHHEFGTKNFTDRRELGILNIGDPGVVVVDGQEHALDRLDCLYAGLGCEQIVFRRAAGQPAFYLASCPAHARHPVAKMTYAQADKVQFGSEETASKRTIGKYIWSGGIPSAQLVMGVTELAPGSIWNTFPPHLHSRRMEAYCYFDLGDSLLIHLMGKPEETRHVVVRDREVVLSPSWSIHSGAGAKSYRFIWAMAGENMEYTDIDPVNMAGLR